MSYQVTFYREVLNSYGKPSTVPLYTTEIAARGCSMDDAIAAAVAAFKQDRDVPCWRTLADGYEVRYEARSPLLQELPARDVPTRDDFPTRDERSQKTDESVPDPHHVPQA